MRKPIVITRHGSVLTAVELKRDKYTYSVNGRKLLNVDTIVAYGLKMMLQDSIAHMRNAPTDQAEAQVAKVLNAMLGKEV